MKGGQKDTEEKEDREKKTEHERKIIEKEKNRWEPMLDERKEKEKSRCVSSVSPILFEGHENLQPLTLNWWWCQSCSLPPLSSVTVSCFSWNCSLCLYFTLRLLHEGDLTWVTIRHRLIRSGHKNVPILTHKKHPLCLNPVFMSGVIETQRALVPSACHKSLTHWAV